MIRHLVVLLACLLGFSCQKSNTRVVVYCAQDPEFAEELFKDFPNDSGLTVSPKFDTEANKSVSLAAELLAEQATPRADLHWNNEILNTIRLARAGVYAKSTRADTNYPPEAQSQDSTWFAFAARARVLIINKNLVPEANRPKSLLDLTNPKWKGKVAMAKPQFGTTATQAAVLFEVLGADAAKDFYKKLKANDVQLVPGNKQVAKGVSEGKFAIGMTDSDDAMVEIRNDQPVVMIFPDAMSHPDHPRLGTILIPNTLAIVKGGPNPTGAQNLLDYLSSARSEARLGAAGAFQIPLNTTLEANRVLPAEMQPVLKAKRAEVNWDKAADLWEDVQTFLRDEFAR
jgi:iron(III) transport system substrate-binding protein